MTQFSRVSGIQHAQAPDYLKLLLRHVIIVWCEIETRHLGNSSEQVQDATRYQGLSESRLPMILNVLSCPVIPCPTDKLVTHLAKT